VPSLLTISKCLSLIDSSKTSLCFDTCGVY